MTDLVRLAEWSSKKVAAVGKFAVVGLFGLLVNTLALAVFAEVFGVHYMLGVVLATQVSTTSNFLLSGKWVFPDENNRRLSLTSRYLAFSGVNNAMLVIRGPMIVALTVIGMNYLAANIVSLLATFVIRFVVADRWVWRSTPVTTTQSAAAP